MKKHFSSKGFTLIELLTNIAIIGIFVAILIPVFGRSQEAARRSVDRANIRQIGQGSLLYADDNRDALPQRNLDSNGLPTGGSSNTTDVKRFAAAIARIGGLNDGNIWIARSDTAGNIGSFQGGPILDQSSPSRVITGPGSFGDLTAISVGVVTGLNLGDRPSSPIAFTRGLSSDGAWFSTSSPYRGEGGHIVFLDGNVRFFEDVRGEDGQGALVALNGSRTPDILRTVSSYKSFRTLPTTGVGGRDGTGTNW